MQTTLRTARGSKNKARKEARGPNEGLGSARAPVRVVKLAPLAAAAGSCKFCSGPGWPAAARSEEKEVARRQCFAAARCSAPEIEGWTPTPLRFGNAGL